MKAIVQDIYGSADVLRLEEVDRPAIGDDDILVKIYAAGVDPSIWHLMTGMPYLVRFFGFGVRKPKKAIRGWDLAGLVETVGRNVKEFAPGDEVFGIGEGSLAEYAKSSAAKLLPKPSNLTFEQSAAIPTSGVTAIQALRAAGKLQAGQHVLVIGASGGVGTFAVQIAKAMGAEVTGVCSTSKLDLVRALGADHVIDYTKETFTDGARRYDLVLDSAGNRPLFELKRALTPKGCAVLVGGEGGGAWLGGIDRNLRASLLSLFGGQTFRGLFSTMKIADLQSLREVAEAGQLRPAVDRTYTLAEAPQAVRDLHEGKIRGKAVIAIASPE